MQKLDAITVRHHGREAHVELFLGDLSRIPQSEAVDVLVVSAFPDDYAATPGSLIGALDRAGVSIGVLAQDKEVDLRKFSACWLSRPITNTEAHFRRILCFEPRYRGAAAEVVGDIFRSLMPFVTSEPPISQIAMPLVASGDQGELGEVMLELLVDAAVHWLGAGLPLEKIKIVAHPSSDTAKLQEAFGRVKANLVKLGKTGLPPKAEFDFFISYSQKDKVPVDYLVEQLRKAAPELRIFLDRLTLRTGTAWQQEIYEALGAARKVICSYSPAYLASRMCIEEFNIAAMRHRESSSGVLLPVYLYTAPLPHYMVLPQYEDVREGDPAKIAAVAERLVRHL